MTVAALRLAEFEPVASRTVDLSVDGLVACYGKREPVFSDVSFSVGRGEAVALVGANGAGKSTLLKCLMGFVTPTDGTVSVFGRDLSALKPGELRRLRAGVGFVAQKHNLVPRLTTLSNVVHGMLAKSPGPRNWIQALAPTESRKRALAALDRVGLADFALRRVDSLSGGSRSAWRSPAPLSLSRASSWPMSLRPASIRQPVRKSWKSSPASCAIRARHSSSPPITSPTRSPMPTASSA
jgi:ABC-type molybdenum transport system ATPase subunit/photorepair protein PhrA